MIPAILYRMHISHLRPHLRDLGAKPCHEDRLPCGRNQAVLEGEKAAAKILPELKAKLALLNEQRHVSGMP
ncbi:MAG: hypothetical protein WCE58_00165 [Gallionella sp.]